MDNSSYIPPGFTALTPMLVVRNASKAIEWYKNVFQAAEINRLTEQDGTVVHAEIRIGDSVLMLSEDNPAHHNKSPEVLNGTSVILNLYVPDVDQTEGLALSMGAISIFPVADQFYGDRAGRIQDPFGHMWIISKNIKNVTPEEMQRKMNEGVN
jgi:PhnB protein